eukprot:scaffold126681_cov33-Tisochrysis_lutea.AAC.1
MEHAQKSGYGYAKPCWSLLLTRTPDVDEIEQMPAAQVAPKRSRDLKGAAKQAQCVRVVQRTATTHK